MKNKLIEIIREVSISGKDYGHYIEDIADKLISDRVIVLPCKVGDKIFIAKYGRVTEKVIEKIEIGSNTILLAFNWNALGYEWLTSDGFGKNIFLTREEAEKALEEMSNE